MNEATKSDSPRRSELIAFGLSFLGGAAALFLWYALASDNPRLKHDRAGVFSDDHRALAVKSVPRFSSEKSTVFLRNLTTGSVTTIRPDSVSKMAFAPGDSEALYYLESRDAVFELRRHSLSTGKGRIGPGASDFVFLDPSRIALIGTGRFMDPPQAIIREVPLSLDPVRDLARSDYAFTGSHWARGALFDPGSQHFRVYVSGSNSAKPMRADVTLSDSTEPVVTDSIDVRAAGMIGADVATEAVWTFGGALLVRNFETTEVLDSIDLPAVGYPRWRKELMTHPECPYLAVLTNDSIERYLFEKGKVRLADEVSFADQTEAELIGGAIDKAGNIIAADWNGRVWELPVTASEPVVVFQGEPTPVDRRWVIPAIALVLMLLILLFVPASPLPDATKSAIRSVSIYGGVAAAILSLVALPAFSPVALTILFYTAGLAVYGLTFAVRSRSLSRWAGVWTATGAVGTFIVILMFRAVASAIP